MIDHASMGILNAGGQDRMAQIPIDTGKWIKTENLTFRKGGGIAQGKGRFGKFKRSTAEVGVIVLDELQMNDYK